MLKAFALIFCGLMVGGMPFSAQAFDMHEPEALRYVVTWGPFKMGRAELDYMPQKGGVAESYALLAHVWDESALIDMDDTWQSKGSHSPRAFTPAEYSAVQKENDYRADKVVTFDAGAGKIRYQNRKDASDRVEPLVWNAQMRDALGAVYAWRLASVEELQKNATVEVMGVKRPFTLKRSAAKREMVSYKGKNVAVWSIDLSTAVDGKPSRDSWTVKLRDDGKLTPVLVVAKTRFGTFSATLKE